MSDPLVSLLIPARDRPKFLERCLRSFRQFDISRVECLVRIDDDEPQMQGYLDLAMKFGFRLIVGPRLPDIKPGGTPAISPYYDELSDACSSGIIWILNDDSYIIQTCATVDPWVDQLSRFPSDFVGYTQHSSHMQSFYWNSPSVPFPIVPKNSWKRFGMDKIPSICDRNLPLLLHDTHGWPICILNGFLLAHDWQW